MQLAVLLVSCALMALVAWSFIVAIRGSVVATPPPPAAATERRRNLLILGMVAAIVVVTGVSLRSWPHAAAEAGTATPDELLVTANSFQWYWELSHETLPVGKPIHFAVTSADVNHGFGLYDEAGTLVTQVQAMPGYISHLVYTFDKPGTYRVLCLEYCGLVHHAMVAEIAVRDEEG